MVLEDLIGDYFPLCFRFMAKQHIMRKSEWDWKRLIPSLGCTIEVPLQIQGPFWYDHNDLMTPYKAPPLKGPTTSE